MADLKAKKSAWLSIFWHDKFGERSLKTTQKVSRPAFEHLNAGQNTQHVNHTTNKEPCQSVMQFKIRPILFFKTDLYWFG